MGEKPCTLKTDPSHGSNPREITQQHTICLLLLVFYLSLVHNVVYRRLTPCPFHP